MQDDPRDLQQASQKKAEAPPLPCYINKNDILDTDPQILDGMGDVEQRLRDFEELMAENRTDFKYLSYNDQAIREQDKEQYVDSLRQADDAGNLPNKLYGINFVQTVETYMEDKYSSLEQQRVTAEHKLEKLVELYYQDQVDLVDEQRRAENNYGYSHVAGGG